MVFNYILYLVFFFLVYAQRTRRPAQQRGGARPHNPPRHVTFVVGSATSTEFLVHRGRPTEYLPTLSSRRPGRRSPSRSQPFCRWRIKTPCPVTRGPGYWAVQGMWKQTETHYHCTVLLQHCLVGWNWAQIIYHVRVNRMRSIACVYGRPTCTDWTFTLTT